jgi:hypothetical protein
VVAVPDAVVVGETDPQAAPVQPVPVNVHVTLTVVEGSFVTVGVIVVELPAFTVVLAAATATVIAGTVIVAVPFLVLSATDVAVRVTVKSLATGPGAVYVTVVVVAPLRVPQFATEQVTVKVTPFAVVSAVSVAVNDCVLPSKTVPLPGEIITVIDGVPPPPQPENRIPGARIIANIARTLILEFMNTPAFVS